MKLYRIAVIPGDGVGSEVSAEAVKLLEGAAEKYGFQVETTPFEWGCDYYLEHGVTVKGATPETVDMIVVRENTEGEYAATGGIFKEGTDDAVAMQTGVFTAKGCERAMRYAFDLARVRKKWGEKDHVGMVTNCTKSNALNYSMVFWDSLYEKVAKDYPDIKPDSAMVDALCMWFVKNPGYFDVIVASNLFGDIITDLGAMIQGGMGLAAGGNINPEKTYPSMFEPIHGSAPKYTGKGIANPIASIESMRMMLEHLGEGEAALDIQRAVIRVLEAKEVRTRDLGGTSRTHEVGDAILRPHTGQGGSERRFYGKIL
ncbi:MAG: isocitrate/isopropylmalate family dehydrogenase [Deltaproteobacteria bacterium]